MWSSSSKDVSKGYGDRLLIDNLDLSIPPGSIVGVIGPNGAGKTTLLRMITGQEKPDNGTIRIGETVKLAYVDQSRDIARPGEEPSGRRSPAAQELIDLGGRKRNSRAYVASFNFLGTDQQKKVGTLSGGERNRVHLAKMLTQRRQRASCSTSRPTTWMSTPCAPWKKPWRTSPAAPSSSRHDRWFLDRVATHILAFEGD